MKVRIKFKKYGALKFIGHLDVMRFFQKAIRRAGIDIRFSEGFNPHQIMSFAAPLGVGMESMSEYLDIEVNSFTSSAKMLDALNGEMVDGISVVSVRKLPDSSKNAMASVAAAGYRIAYKDGSFPIDDMETKIADFYAKEQIPVTKKTKKNVVELDLKAGIYDLKTDISAGDYPAIYMLVDASSSGNIKPAMVLDAFCAFCGIELPPYSYQITRLETYTRETTEDGKEKLVPLEDIGCE